MPWALLPLAFAVMLFPQIAKAECTLVSNGETRPTGTIIHNADHNVLQACTNDGTWQALTPVVNPCDPAQGPTPGTACGDGSIYVGLSPDGNVAMYTTLADAPSTYTWNDGTTNYQDTAMANCTDGSPGTAATCQTGEANTAFLIGATGEPDYPFAAAEYCYGLSAHGHSDWYLPAQDELNVLYTNKNTGALNGTFDETGSSPGGYYRSSSEGNSSSARGQRFSNGVQSIYAKQVGYSVRCVRKE